jgi:hypothetical protein
MTSEAGGVRSWWFDAISTDHCRFLSTEYNEQSHPKKIVAD